MIRTGTRIVLLLTLVTATLALALPAPSLTRTFVSAAGSDSNPCTITQPCATFAHAYSVTAASGIVAALDPGKYGPLTITGAITINGNGWAAITAPATGNGITITAGASDNVALIGLEIDGAGAGYNGIVLNSAGSLTVTNCTLQNFVQNGGLATGNGILMQPTTGTLTFTITNTTASNNATAGISFFPPSGSPSANGVIDHVVADANNTYGIGVYPLQATGGSVVVTISNSIASNNINYGIFAGGGSATLKVSIDSVSISGNNGVGIDAATPANVLLGRSVITGNNIGVFNGTSPNTFGSYRDNRINLNSTDVNGAMNTLTAQ